MNFDIVSTYWFTAMTGLVGVVVCQDRFTHERKAYIGTAKGLDEKEDELHIAQTGAKMHLASAEAIVSALKNSKGM